MMRLLILVVVYRRALLESETLVTLSLQRSALEESEILVWDNSPAPADESQRRWLRQALPHASYCHDGANPGLSTVYNRVIQKHIKSGPALFDYFVILDHDSRIPETFFSALQDSTTRYSHVNLFLPLVRCGGRIVSPANFHGFVGWYWKNANPGLVAARNKTAINSGMVIASTYLREEFPGYDERFHLYNIDNYFMLEYAKTNSHFAVFDTEIQHDLARFSEKNLEIRLKRHRENLSSLRLLARSSAPLSVLAHAYCQLFKLRQAIKFRDLRFLQ